jgi:glycosyltransferase involved in cell wall biosynthesis
LPAARNAAVDFARGKYLFVLDSDNAVFPNGLGHLVQALDADPGASFAYGILACFKDDRPFAIMSCFPWEPKRLRLGNYIDAMALFRAEIVRGMGGYSTDRRLYGWEDYDLYCRLAEYGHRGRFLERIVASYTSSDTSMLAITNVSWTSAYMALKEHAPRLMDGVTPPL